jgi:hypothetical protein
MEIAMKKLITAILLILSVLALPVSVSAQEASLEINFTRDWGYGGFAGEIQGKFSLRVSGPATLVEVHFLIDGEPMATITAPPFNFQFDTDTYPPGQHTLTAVGVLLDGTQLTGPKITRVFLSAEEAKEATYQLIVPMLVGIGGITLLATVIPLVFSRKSQHKFKQYGIAGGAVCKRCALPFSRGVFSPNMFFGKLERCPHCGKWAIVRSATPQELAEAESRYLQGENKLERDADDQEERLRKALDETRYE